jgi:hypothetical protein
MSKKSLLFTGLLLLVLLSHGQEKDTILFLNKIMLVGSFKNISMGRISFDADDVGMVNIKSYKVKALSVKEHELRIETISNKVLYGKMINSIYSEKINFVTESKDTIPLSLNEIIAASFYENGFWKRLSGNASLGYSYSRSSNIGRLNFDANVKFKAKNVEVNNGFSTILTSDGTNWYTERANAQTMASYLFTSRLTAFSLFNYQKNLELGIQRRFQEGLGVGYKLLVKSILQASAMTGIVVNQEKSTSGNSISGLYELPILFQFQLYKFTNPNITINLSQTGYVGITQKGRFREDGQLSVNWEIISDMNVGFTFYNNYDNQPPVQSSRKTDYSIAFTLGYKFNN